ncbi:MAG: nucleotidyltransferase substrate binding protein [Candidatus Pacebacteria bacterium]|nr:nucleotidyltransferase substrate binding protein [Candidatus Paceibacterota bacterium]
MLLNEILKDFEKAIQKLEKVLKLKKTDIIRDSGIKRFELCFDLAWKSAKEFARNQRVECYSPVECFKSAFQLKLIDYDTEWLDMVKDRNLTVHLYKEEMADKVYKNLPGYLKMFKSLLKKIQEEM